MKRDKEWIKENVNPHKIMESFLWFSFSKLSEEELVRNLKEYRDIFKMKLIDDEREWIEKQNVNDRKTKDEYMEDVKDEIEKTTETSMLHIQKLVGQMKLDKDSWKKELGLNDKINPMNISKDGKFLTSDGSDKYEEDTEFDTGVNKGRRK